MTRKVGYEQVLHTRGYSPRRCRQPATHAIRSALEGGAISKDAYRPLRSTSTSTSVPQDHLKEVGHGIRASHTHSSSSCKSLF